jgi:hypothetical protein
MKFKEPIAEITAELLLGSDFPYNAEEYRFYIVTGPEIISVLYEHKKDKNFNGVVLLQV